MSPCDMFSQYTDSLLWRLLAVSVLHSLLLLNLYIRQVNGVNNGGYNVLLLCILTPRLV